jgi:hypothetical protein
MMQVLLSFLTITMPLRDNKVQEGGKVVPYDCGTITMPHRDKKVQEGGKVVPYDCGILYTYSSYGDGGFVGANANDSKTTWSSSLLILAPQEQERNM